MTRRLRCYVAAPRSLARSVVQIHTMLEDHDVKPTSLWADGVMSTASDGLSDAQLDPRRARWILDDNRKAIAASDVIFAYMPEPPAIYPGHHHGESGLYREPPKETYCELEAARTAGKFIFILGSGSMVPLSILVACHDGDARIVDSVTTAIDLISEMAVACRAFAELAPCLLNLWGEDDPRRDAEEEVSRWRLVPGGG